MSRYKAYGEYKDSGVEWLGRIPKHWISTILKRYSSVQGGYAFSSESYLDVGVPIIRIGDITSDGCVSLESCKRISIEISGLYDQYMVKSGDLLMAMTGATIGKAGWYTSEETALLNQRVGAFKCDDSKLNFRFFWHVLNSGGYQEYIRLTAFGGAQPNISDSGMVGYYAAIPSILEQQSIANFLDHETAKIDTLIAKQQELIKLLKEKRQAVISHAVTKGLNPNAPMRDSGVEWLGEVPAHWRVLSLKYLANLVGTGGTPKEASSFTDDSEVHWFTPGDFNGTGVLSRSSKYITALSCVRGDAKLYSGGSVLIIGIGATLGKVAYCSEDFSCNQQINIVTPNRNITCKYMAHALKVQTEQMKQLSNFSTIGIMNQEKTKLINIAVPPIVEQKIIDDFLNMKIDGFELLLERAVQQIDLLQERRTALITAAVTGKIDVRDWRPAIDSTKELVQ